MINIIWTVMLLSGLAVAAVNGRLAQTGEAMMAGAQQAATLLIGLWGGYAMWTGLMHLMRQSGMVNGLARLMRRPVKKLLSDLPEGALEAVLLNISANMLGLGNAATPFGLQAMRLMEEKNPHPGRATDAMAMFLIINASSVQLIPTTVLTLRINEGAASAGIIVLPTLAATLLSSAAGIAAALIVRRYF